MIWPKLNLFSMFLSAYYEPKEMRERQTDLAIASALQDDKVSKGRNIQITIILKE